MDKLMNTWRETLDILNETTYSRVRAKIEKENIPFVVMSADRHDTPNNRQRNKELKATVKAMVNTGQTLPDNLFNVYEAKIANVKIPKGE